MEWKSLGALKDPTGELAEKGGVYIWIVPGNIQRVYCVGTTSHFRTRLTNESKPKVYTLFKHDFIGDIYDVMSFRSRQAEEYPDFVKHLAHKDLVWVPDKYNSLWTEEWEKAHKDFKSRVKVYGCEVQDETQRLILEARLLIALGEKNHLAYYTDPPWRQNWLGQQEPEGKGPLRNLSLLDQTFAFGDSVDMLGLSKGDLEAFRDETNRKLIEDYFKRPYFA